jgi:2-dehydropantoate 2-reductase
MRFLIYGAGALGQAVGCMLAASGNNVELITRSRFIPAIAQQGLRVTGIFGDYFCQPKQLRLFTNLEQVTGLYDYILVTTKAYDTRTAAQDISAANLSCGHLVSMQNGCGNMEILTQHFAAEKCLGARVITGFEIREPGHVAITVSADAIHVGSCLPGSIPAAARQLAELITAAGHPTLAVADIHRSLHAKLLYNCTLNPLGALLGVHYGILGEIKESKEIMDQVIDETMAVIEAMGRTMPWPNGDAYRQEFYSKLLPATYHHRPSMLQDLESSKPTEIDALTGYVSKEGAAHGVATPVCDMLTRLVRCRQQLARKQA